MHSQNELWMVFVAMGFGSLVGVRAWKKLAQQHRVPDLQVGLLLQVGHLVSPAARHDVSQRRDNTNHDPFF